jgi:hypothetical protein
VHGAAVAGGLQALGRVDEGAHPGGPLVGCGLRGRLVPRAVGEQRRGRREAGPAGVDGGQRDRRDGAFDQRRQAGPVDHGGRAADGPAVEVDPQPDSGGRVGHVLVDAGVGEPGQRQRGVVDQRFGLGGAAGQPADEVDDPAREIELRGHQPVTPTRTPVNRAGAAGCPVCPVWPG